MLRFLDINFLAGVYAQMFAYFWLLIFYALGILVSSRIFGAQFGYLRITVTGRDDNGFSLDDNW